MACASCGSKATAGMQYEVTIRATGEKLTFTTLSEARVEMGRRGVTGYSFRLVPKK